MNTLTKAQKAQRVRSIGLTANKPCPLCGATMPEAMSLGTGPAGTAFQAHPKSHDLVIIRKDVEVCPKADWGVIPS